MKTTFVLALGCATFLAVSRAQDDDEGEEMGGAAKPTPDVVGNIIYVMEKLGEKVVPEPEARKNMREYLKKADTCFRRADGLQIKIMTKFVERIPRALDCIAQTFGAKNKRDQDKAVKCFISKLILFQKKHNVPMEQVEKVGAMIACLKDSFLMVNILN